MILNYLRRPKYWLQLLFGMLFMLPIFIFGFGESVHAGALTNLSVSTSDATKSATATYTISFTNATAIPATNGRIYIEFASLWCSGDSSSTGNVNFDSATVASTTSPTTIKYYSSRWNGVVLYPTSAIAADTAISVVLSNVKNPARGGYYSPHIWTQNLSTALDGTSTYGGNYLASPLVIGTNTNVTGTVTDGLGTNVGGAYVTIYNNNWSKYCSGYTSANGTYGFGDVSADTYYINLNMYVAGSNKTYFAPAPTTFVVASSGTVTKNVDFEPPTKKVTGVVKLNDSAGTVVTDANVYAWRSGSGWASTTTNSSGEYTLEFPGGKWNLNIYPTNWDNAAWIHSNYNIYAEFATSTTSESKTQNFTAEKLSAAVKGTITLSDGTAPKQYSTGISFSNSKSQGFSGKVNTDGTFTAKMTPSTYSTYGWISSDTEHVFPTIDNFSVGDNETKDLGTIKLTKKTDQIKVTITENTASGAGVTGASVSSWKNDNGYDYANATTDANGKATLKTVPGKYQVSAWPKYNPNGSPEHVYSGKAITVEVKSGVAAEVNFIFQKATNRIDVRVTDPDGNTLTSLSSSAGASDGAQEWNNVWGQINSGTGFLMVPKGKWTVTVYVYGSDYSSPDPQTAEFTGDNATKSLTFKAVKNDVTLKGFIKDESGNKITGKYMSIYASKGKYGSWQSAILNQDTGEYTLKLSAGTWQIGWWVDYNSGYSSGNGQDLEFTFTAGETKSYDVVLKKANAKIYGKAKKPDGTAMQWAWITADTRDPNTKTEATMYYYSNGGSSNTNGDYELKLPAGTYWVGGNMWYGSGYLNPQRQKVTVEADKSVEVNLTFRSADGEIKGDVTLPDGTGTNAYVTLWGEDGAAAETNSANGGSYAASVTKGTKWHVKAMKKDGDTVYKSKEAIVDLASTTTGTQNLKLVKQSYSLPEGQNSTGAATQLISLKFEDGTTVTAPANTIATTGNVTLKGEPNPELADEPDAKPIAYGYDLTATDDSGTALTNTFSGEGVTIEAKYTEETVKESKVQSEEELTIGYYDKSAGTWKELTDCNVNDEENTVTCKTTHFTTFAIIASADTTPTGIVTNLKATAGEKKVSLDWKNPTDSDFKSVNIYRSTKSGEVGDKVHSSITGTSYADSGLTADTTYYYTFRALDASGNESLDSTQVSAKPTAAASTSSSSSSNSLPKTGSPFLTLKWIIWEIVFLSIALVAIVKSRRRQARLR